MLGPSTITDSSTSSAPPIRARRVTVWQRIEAPSPTVFRRVDYVFVKAGDGREATAVSARVVLNTPETRDDGGALWPSDHYGVFAEVTLRPASAR